MNRLVERNRDGGHLTWSHVESNPPPLLGRREGWREKKEAEIIAENFQTVNVTLKVRLMVAVPSTRSFLRTLCQLSVRVISIFNAINILVSPLKFGFIHSVKVWCHNESCKLGMFSKIYESSFDLVQAWALIWLITFSRWEEREAKSEKIKGRFWSPR